MVSAAEGFFLETLAKCKPQALQSVRAPSGPLRHSGVSFVPQPLQQLGAGARLRFLYLVAESEGRTRRSSDIISCSDGYPCKTG